MLDYVALGIVIVVGLTIIYGFVFIHDIPYNIAKSRNHPHSDAIHVGGWISLFTLHAIWPFLWIWAMIYNPDHGYGFNAGTTPDTNNDSQQLIDRIEALEKTVASFQAERVSEDVLAAPSLPQVQPLNTSLRLTPTPNEPAHTLETTKNQDGTAQPQADPQLDSKDREDN